MAELFEKDRTVIGRHISNVFKEGELVREEVSAKIAHTTQHGARQSQGQVLGLEAAITQICPKAMVVPKAIPQGHTNKKMSAQSQRTHQNVFTF